MKRLSIIFLLVFLFSCSNDIENQIREKTLNMVSAMQTNDIDLFISQFASESDFDFILEHSNLDKHEYAEFKKDMGLYDREKYIKLEPRFDDFNEKLAWSSVIPVLIEGNYWLDEHMGVFYTDDNSLILKNKNNQYYSVRIWSIMIDKKIFFFLAEINPKYDWTHDETNEYFERYETEKYKTSVREINKNDDEYYFVYFFDEEVEREKVPQINKSNKEIEKEEAMWEEKKREEKRAQLEAMEDLFEPIEETNKANSSLNGIYPHASDILLNASDLQNMSKYDLKIMRNEIFARHGHIFKSGGEMEAYFNKQEWYRGTVNDASSLLTDIEKKNVKLILEYE